MYEAIIERVARTILNADALLIGAGAGMSVDSGLPAFRGDKGFWTAYPAFRGRSYSDVTQPRLMEEDPDQAWGFYGHCMSLYRSTPPHDGFQIVRRWAERVGEHFVFTSNIDGHFQRSGFEEQRILEIHGSTRFMQCTRGLTCGREIWASDGIHVDVDDVSFRAISALPTCIVCGSTARPNILMFGDKAWNPLRTAEQEDRYEDWHRRVSTSNIVAIEFGAGTAVPTVRYECRRRSKKLVRVNPVDYHAPDDAISVPLNALDAIRRIDESLLAMKK